MTAAFTLTPGSPEARAVYQLMADERLVRLDPACEDPTGSAAAVVRQLLALVEWENQHASRAIHFLVNDRTLKPQVAHRLVDELAGEVDPIGPIQLEGKLHGQPHPVLHNQKFEVGPPARQRTADLFVVGFDPHPWRNLSTDMFFRRWTRANQVLIVGPELPWQDDYFRGLLGRQVQYQVWGPVTMEVVVAGAT